MKTYRVNEVFYSIQGEGMRAGTANIFIRFTGCNMRCEMAPGPKSPSGFDCDTEFVSGRDVTLDELHGWIYSAIIIAADPDEVMREQQIKPGWIILTGGEPGLQVDKEFCDYFHNNGYKLAIETNGSINIAETCSAGKGQGVFGSAIDWITVSPKVAEHAIRQQSANEVKYVRGYGQAIPKTSVTAEHYLISPAFDGLQIDPRTIAWCNKLVLENPKWRLSLQLHKFMKVR